jgi:hypothetical protein
MLNKFFFAQNIMQGEPPLGNVVFTVKEWFLDPEDDFTDTEIGALEGITVKIIGQTEKVTDVNGQAGFNLANGTYTYQVYEMDSQLTTVQGEITVSGTLAVDVKLYECLYTPTEVQELIDDDSYVPVATSTELDDLRNTGSRTMGAGTIWAGTYTTGTDKKYIQTKNIHYNDNFSVIVSTGITYNGNMLVIEGLNINSGACWIGTSDASSCTLRNIIFVKCTTIQESLVTARAQSTNGIDVIENIELYDCHSTTAATNGSLLFFRPGNNSTINNIKAVDCSVISTTASNRAIIIASNLVNSPVVQNIECVGCYVQGVNNLSIVYGSDNVISNLTNIKVMGCGINGAANIGMIASVVRQTSQITKCYAINSTITTSNTTTGGLVGQLFQHTGLMLNCHADVTINGSGTYIGGLVGWQRSSGERIKNCYSIGHVNITPASTIGGLVGANAGAITNSYYDTQTSGQSDTGKGLPRTTAQMKAGTASSFILPDGTTDPDNLAANAMYTSWDTAIWDFLTTNDYPILR